jgi:hypothetical protein
MLTSENEAGFEGQSSGWGVPGVPLLSDSLSLSPLEGRFALISKVLAATLGGDRRG